MSVCDQLIKREENDPFLKRMIMSDEKWIVYNNVSRKRNWSRWSTGKASKGGDPPKEGIMLSNVMGLEGISLLWATSKEQND